MSRTRFILRPRWYFWDMRTRVHYARFVKREISYAFIARKFTVEKLRDDGKNCFHKVKLISLFYFFLTKVRRPTNSYRHVGWMAPVYQFDRGNSNWDRPSPKIHWSVRSLVWLILSSRFFSPNPFLSLCVSFTLSPSPTVAVEKRHPKEATSRRTFNNSSQTLISSRNRSGNFAFEEITAETGLLDLWRARDTRETTNLRNKESSSRLPARREIPTSDERTRALARMRRVCTDFPASARERCDHFRWFSPEKSETGLSVSQPTRSEGCHPRQWGCGPSRLRYAPARV